MKHFLAVALVLTILVCNCNNANAQGFKSGIGLDKILRGVTAPITTAVASITDTLQGLVDTVKNLVTSDQQAIDELRKDLEGLADLSVQYGSEAIEKASEIVTKLIENLGNPEKLNVFHLVDLADQEIGEIIDRLSTNLQAVIDDAILALNTKRATIGQALDPVLNKVPSLRSIILILLLRIKPTTTGLINALIGKF